MVTRMLNLDAQIKVCKCIVSFPDSPSPHLNLHVHVNSHTHKELRKEEGVHGQKAIIELLMRPSSFIMIILNFTHMFSTYTMFLMTFSSFLFPLPSQFWLWSPLSVSYSCPLMS